MPKSKLSAFFSLVLVFASGALVGAVGHRLYTVNPVSSGSAISPMPPRQKMDPEEARRRLIADMKLKVQLDEKQIVQLNHIYDQTKEQFDQLFKKRNADGRAIWEAQTERIRAILRPDQLPLYEQYRANREAERDAERKKHRGPGGSPPGSK
jgi:hypothetical protein